MKGLKNKLVPALFALAGVLSIVPAVVEPVIKGERSITLSSSSPSRSPSSPDLLRRQPAVQWRSSRTEWPTARVSEHPASVNAGSEALKVVAGQTGRCAARTARRFFLDRGLW